MIETCYRKLRREHPYYSARTCLAIARQREQYRTFWQDDGATWAAGGFTYAAKMDYDDDADTSWLGKFTDDPDGAIRANPRGSWREYEFFRPENPGAAEIPYYRRAGMGRHEAWLRAMELDRDAMERAREPEFYGVTVTCYRNGEELGSASLWGVEDDYPYAYCASVAVEELAPEATNEAWRTLARRLGTVAEVLA